MAIFGCRAVYCGCVKSLLPRCFRGFVCLFGFFLLTLLSCFCGLPFFFLFLTFKASQVCSSRCVRGGCVKCLFPGCCSLVWFLPFTLLLLPVFPPLFPFWVLRQSSWRYSVAVQYFATVWNPFFPGGEGGPSFDAILFSVFAPFPLLGPQGKPGELAVV